MLKNTHKGFMAIVVVVVIALIAITGAYYAGTLHANNDVEVIQATTTDSLPVASNKKSYTSNIFGIQFEYPKEWYAHEKLRFGSDISFLSTSTRPDELNASCECDGDLYYSLARINVMDSYATKEEALKETTSLLMYRGVTEQMINDENIQKPETYPRALELAKQAGVKIGKTFFINKNGLRVVRQYGFGELNGERIVEVYFVYVGDKIYRISGKNNDVFNPAEDAVLRDIAESFNVVK
ncbi:MAG: hypothetical protein V4576_02655 [Patescibacteria group bacterium]